MIRLVRCIISFDDGTIYETVRDISIGEGLISLINLIYDSFDNDSVTDLNICIFYE